MELLKKQPVIEGKTKTAFNEFINKHKMTFMLSVMSFFASRIVLPGSISPFSLSFILASKNNLLVILSSFLGILSLSGIITYKYALINIFGISMSYLLKWVFPKINENHSEPSVVFISVFVFGLIFILFKDYIIYDVLLVMFEAVVSFLSYFIIKKGISAIKGIKSKRFFTTEETVTILVIATVVICGIGNIKLPLGISLKNLICITVTFFGISSGNIGISAQIAVFMGLAAGLSSDYIGIYAGTFVFNSLIASVFSKYGKFISILGFVTGNVIMNILLTYDFYMVIPYTEIALGAVIYLIMPDNIFNKMFLTLMSKINDYDKASAIKKIATVKLDRLSIAFIQLADTISSTVLKNNKTGVNSIDAISDAVADKVCKKCALKIYCWQKDYETTIKAMTKAAKAIEEKGDLDINDFPDYFKGKCVKSKEIVNSLANIYELYRLNYIWQIKMKENTKIYREQFLELSDIVQSLKEEIEKNPYFDEELSLEVSSALEKEGYSVKKVNVIKDYNENTTVEILLFPCQNRDKCFGSIREILEDVLDIPFVKTSGKCSYKECVLIYKESESFNLKTSVKQKTKPGSEASGDNYSIKTLENSNKYIALCDGSGSGKTAGEYSLNTLKLLEEFLKTGFSKSASVKLINSSLICNNENDYFSTIDLSIIDLKNGELEIIKKGACPTYIKHANGEFEVIRNNSFPLGVVRNESNSIKKIQLRNNDIIVMISDGIFDSLSSEDWVLEALKAINSNDTESISDVILKIASSTENKDKDDMTVIVSKVCENHKKIS